MKTRPFRIHLLVAALTALAAGARTASDFFAAAPDHVIRLLPQATRLDMLDYFNYGSTRPSANAFGGEARVMAVSPSAVGFTPAEGVDMQLAVLPAGSDTVVALVTTLALPAPDSSVEFFDTSWRPLRRPPFVMPGYDDWLLPDARRDAADIRLALPFMPVRAEFDPDATMLRLTCQAPAYLAPAEADKLKDKLADTMVYDIAAGRFTLRR